MSKAALLTGSKSNTEIRGVNRNKRLGRVLGKVEEGRKLMYLINVQWVLTVVFASVGLIGIDNWISPTEFLL